ncbi:hypothetical protein J1614_006786 [Plenodomus biglobosus]|nr:hypothetical protein J1614_006786 [Plenodomus biglobosus]
MLKQIPAVATASPFADHPTQYATTDVQQSIGEFFFTTSKQSDKHCRYLDGLDGGSPAPWKDGMFSRSSLLAWKANEGNQNRRFVSVHLSHCAWVR